MKFKFADDIFDADEISALIGNTLILKNGKEHCVSDATANAVRRAFNSYPEPSQDTRGTAEGRTPSSELPEPSQDISSSES